MSRGRPQNEPWTEKELSSFRQALAAWMRENDYNAISLEEELGYNSKGLLVRTYLGAIDSAKPPSRPFIEKLRGLGFNGSHFERDLHVTVDTVSRHELPPGTVVCGEPVQCPECVAEAKEGKRPWSKTWYVFAWGNQIHCSEDHRRAWYRRQNQ